MHALLPHHYTGHRSHDIVPHQQYSTGPDRCTHVYMHLSDEVVVEEDVGWPSQQSVGGLVGC